MGSLRILYYNTIREKLDLKNQANRVGESTIHDDYLDINNNPTDGTKGRLTFDVKPDQVLSPDELRLRELNRKLIADTITDLELREYLRRIAIEGVI